ncbi:hypothetical protein SU32_09180 [Ahrensia marina]|uniref:Uncharacterized protein n=1 Tax=Ahrensia marina TaxID=1514904 RepID=A0A0N0E7N6_9HYPH|nr:hypothetical protein SU32_09180 [Ahrensia marina]
MFPAPAITLFTAAFNNLASLWVQAQILSDLDVVLPPALARQGVCATSHTSKCTMMRSPEFGDFL